MEEIEDLASLWNLLGRVKVRRYGGNALTRKNDEVQSFR